MPRPTDEDRFWSKVVGPDPLGCWLWTGSVNGLGYGQFGYRGRTVRAHRWAFEHLRAQIEPRWLTIDHLCCVPACVNPWHMEPVPLWVNVQRIAARGRWRGGAPKTPEALARMRHRQPSA